MSGIADKIEAAMSSGEIVTIFRDSIDPEVTSEGFVVAMSKELVLIHRLDDSVRLDGYEVLRASDISDISTDFRRKRFLEAACRLKGSIASCPEGISLDGMSALLRTAQASFPLLVIERELATPGECEIGRVRLVTERTYTLDLVTIEARWREPSEHHEVAEITRVGFGAEYESTLDLVLTSS